MLKPDEWCLTLADRLDAAARAVWAWALDRRVQPAHAALSIGGPMPNESEPAEAAVVALNRWLASADPVHRSTVVSHMQRIAEHLDFGGRVHELHVAEFVRNPPCLGAWEHEELGLLAEWFTLCSRSMRPLAHAGTAATPPTKGAGRPLDPAMSDLLARADHDGINLSAIATASARHAAAFGDKALSLDQLVKARKRRRTK